MCINYLYSSFQDTGIFVIMKVVEFLENQDSEIIISKRHLMIRVMF